jgi:superfamily I DNA/RNA helicase
MTDDEVEFQAAIQRVVSSRSRKKLVVAGPGTGKTTLFRALLKASVADPDSYLVLTFINNLRKDLEIQLSKYAKVSTLHSYCLGLLYQKPNLRFGLSSAFRCQPGLAGLICTDWKYIEKSDAPRFVQQMRKLEATNDLDFYLKRGDYYDAVDFDDSVFRVYKHAAAGADAIPVTH